METNVLDWLEVTAAACPDKPAFLDEDSAVTFADVRREARIIGTAAAKFRAGQKRPIAVMSGRNAHTPAVFLGAVYAGCCYAPMDGTMPVHRLNSILNTLDTDLMIVQRAFYDKAKTLDFSGTILIAEELLAGSEDAALLADCRARARELDPLYIIFTSGSTGTPKGVITAQHSLMCYIEDYAGVMGIARADVLGNQSPLDYIAAVRDIYLPLRFGATTAIIPKELFMSPERLFEYMNDKGVTAVGWSVSALTVPAALGAFECSAPQHLRKVCFSGSVMPCSCLRQWQLALPEARFVNQYGPTEATASCTYYVVPGLVEDTDVLPIGRPYPHYEVFLLSERNEAVPDGEIGEICVKGPILALGYYNSREKTAESFLQNPLNHAYDERIYKTGDLGHFAPDGNLMFHGRKDRQVKHLGHRVELGEIDLAAAKVARRGGRLRALRPDARADLAVLHRRGRDQARHRRRPARRPAGLYGAAQDRAARGHAPARQRQDEHARAGRAHHRCGQALILLTLLTSGGIFIMEQELMDILTDLRPDVDFETETALIDDHILESFDIVSLVAALNDAFDIEIGAKDLVPENFNSAKSLLAMVQRLQDED